ncbi:MAG: HAMP domain-containing histidine kinase, partial [Flavobacteriales bacterium]|nr:HAMP domain-containing histidine kinase [Flavobacteriales bacterium]
MTKTIERAEHHSITSDRFTNSMVAAASSTCFLHFVLTIFYFIIKVPEMWIYSATTFFLFLLWRKLFKNNWIKTPFVLGSINVGIGIIMANYFIGWESNFNIYFIILPSALLIYTGWKNWERAIYLILVGTLYVVLFLTFSNFTAVYDINSEILKYVSMVNTLSAGGMLIIILFFFNSSITKMQESLENQNKHLENKTNELNRSLIKEQELGQLKTSFVSTASHQFRTPLAAIQSNSELLEMLSNNMDGETSKRFQKVTGRITGEIGKMTEIMDDVLILGKLTSGNVDVKPEELNLVDFCQKLAEEFDDVQHDGRIMEIITDGEPYNVYLDSKLLSHSLSNLFSNAFKYSLGKGNPKLIISFISKGFSLTIEDYGMGIPKSEMPNLFHPFFRANNVTE